MIYIILILIILILLLEKIIDKKNQNYIDSNTEQNKSYEKKEYLLTQNELKFYKIIKKITDKLELNLFCQVALYEIIKTKNYKEFNKIKSKSIDFVITEQNCKIKLCIELDDSTHNNAKRIERDNFINKIFEETGTKIIRIKVQNFYNIEELEKTIKDSF